MRIVDSDIVTTGNDEVLVSVDDDGTVAVTLVIRDPDPDGVRVLSLRPEAAHELGNKLRLASKAAG